MALTCWIEAINSGGAQKNKQKAPAFFANIIHVLRGVLPEWFPPAPLILG